MDCGQQRGGQCDVGPLLRPDADSPALPPLRDSSASAWKVFTDPAKTVSFEVPQDWIVQSVAADSGALPGALKIIVKDAKGAYLATLQTGLPPQPAAACADGAARDYVVVSSVPVDLPHGGGEGTIDPHVVFRVIQGYKYFGSYGITNVVGGAGGKAARCRTWSAARTARATIRLGT